MLSKIVEQIQTANPELVGMDDVIEKEILHHDILSVLHNEGFLSKLTFMGGTSIRICYGGSRLSEDLDFSCGKTFKKKDFKGMDSYLETFLKNKYQLNVTVREPKSKTGNTSTWKITIEKHSHRPDIPSQKMHIDVCSVPSYDVEHRPIIDHFNIKSPISGLPIAVQSQEELLADKMVAFAYRKRRIKPRDVWDIVWLTQQQQNQNGSLVTQKLQARGKEKEEFVCLIAKHSALIQNSTDSKKDFYNEMSRFLPQGVLARTLEQPKFWPYVGTVIKEQTESLIRQMDGDLKTPSFKL